jgi:hypothetical protein
MRYSQRSLSLALAALAALSLSACGGGGNDDNEPARLAAATPGTLNGSCEALATTLSGMPNTSITAATTVAAGAITASGAAAASAPSAPPVAEHCLVTGRMFERTSSVDGGNYAIGFQMRLPKAWNGRFYYQGNGGTDGAVATAVGALGGGPLTGALHQGFAVISSDAGHSGTSPLFGLDPQARLDYGYQAVGKLTPMAKEAIRRAYGKAPDRSYIGGTSNGGRHAMVAAARYADQYDGYLIGAPGFNLPKAAVAEVWGAQRYATVATGDPTTPAGLETAFTLAERRMVGNAIVAKCDALDGAADGMVLDTQACQSSFNLQTGVPTCAGARDGTCLTAAQKNVVASIFAGATTSTGTPFYASFPYDPGIAGAGIAQWEFTSPISLERSGGATPFIFQVPPPSPTGFNPVSFALNANIDALVAGINATNSTYTESPMTFMTPPNPTDLSTVRNRGAKMIIYHGVSDPAFSYNDTKTWYDGLRAANGGDASNFARLYPVPHMNHSNGGPATDQFDMLTPLVRWVEFGEAPGAIIAGARGPGNPVSVNADVPSTWSIRTRPLCPYPQVARYRGTGSIESAASFTCQ